MAATPVTTDRWYYSHSSTLRSIYVLRYLLFSGGAAVAGALVQRSLVSTRRPALGLMVGLVVGLVVFVGQLRHAFAPRLALSRDALYLLTYRRMARLPWELVREVLREGNDILLRLSAPVSWEGVGAVAEVRLNARWLGSTAAQLQSNLRALATDAGLRQKLPLDADLRSRVKRSYLRAC